MASRLYIDTRQEGSRFVRAGRGLFGLAERQPRGIDAQVQQINLTTRAELRKRLLSMPPARFEALIGELLIQMGFDESTVRVTKRSGDGGIDVVGVYRAAGLTEVDAAVQVKRWKSNVRAPVVTQLRGSLQVHQQGIIITTSDFSKGARKEASASNKTHIGLIDGEQLLDLLIKHGVGVEEQTLRVISLDDEWWGELLSDGDEVLEMAPSQVEMPAPAEDAPKKGKTSVQPGQKPVSFTLLGETFPASTWREVLVTTCAALARRHPDDFAAIATTVKGRKRQYIAPAPDGMINPAPIPGTDLWVETNQSAKSVVRLVEKLLAAFGYSPDDFAVHMDTAAAETASYAESRL
jgi:restriction system protein